MTDDDRQMLQAILDHCSARCEASGRAVAAGPCPVADARRRMAYARVMRAARELLDEMEG